MSADKTGNPLTQAECSNMLTKCRHYNLALRLRGTNA